MSNGEQASNQLLSHREEEGTEFSPSGSVNFQFGESLLLSERRQDLEIVYLWKPPITTPDIPGWVPLLCCHGPSSLFSWQYFYTELFAPRLQHPSPYTWSYIVSVCPSGSFSMHICFDFSWRGLRTMSGRKVVHWAGDPRKHIWGTRDVRGDLEEGTKNVYWCKPLQVRRRDTVWILDIHSWVWQLSLGH